MQAQKATTCNSCGKTVNEGNFFCRQYRATVGDFAPVPAATGADLQATAPARSRAGQGTPAATLLGYILENRYRLDAELGRGSMGSVYRATRLHIGDEVAIKILHPERVADPHTAERFRREAQAAARLKHPNAVSVYDFGVDRAGLFYLVMELAVGQSLRQFITERKTLPAAQAVEIIVQVCAALDEAHARQLIHRDIKPDNIIVNQLSPGWSVKVLDFGIAKLCDQGMENITQTMNVLGTPHYMSPEQCLGEELDARSDVYSAGVVLYEMLSGAVPFNSPIPTAIVIQHVNQAPPSLRMINAGIPAAVEALVMRALTKQREGRPQSAGAFAQQLLAAVGGDTFARTAPPPAAPTIPFAPSSGAADTPGYMPTVVLPSTSLSQPGSVSKQQAKSSFSAPLLFFSILLAVGVGSAFTYYFAQNDRTDVPAATQGAATGTEKTSAPKPAASVVAPTGQSLTNTAQPAPVSRPADGRRFAYCQYVGVNLRVSPSRDSMLVATIGKNQGVWVLEESNNTDTFIIRSEERVVTDNWSRVELADNPNVRGWVFSGFLSKE